MSQRSFSFLTKDKIMSISFKKYALLLGVSLLLACPFFVSGQEILPEGGSGFSDAVLMEEGDYEYNTDIASWFSEYGDEAYYFLGDVKPGQEVNIEITTEGEKYMRAAILDSKRQEVSSVEDQGAFNVSWSKGSEGGVEDYHLKITSQTSSNENFTLSYNVDNYFDAGSNQDAGHSIPTALRVDLGEYDGYLSGKEGNDEIDCYEVDVESGKALGVRVTPSVNLYAKLNAYNTAREEIFWKEASNPGAIVEGVMDPEGTTVYLCLEGGYTNKVEKREYTLELTEEDLSEDGETPTGPTGTTSDGPGDYDMPEGDEIGGVIQQFTGQDGFLPFKVLGIFGGLIRWFFRLLKIFIALIIVGIIIFFIVRSQKKKKKKEEEPTETPTENPAETTKEEFKGE